VAGATVLWGLGAFDDLRGGLWLAGLAHVTGAAAIVLVCIEAVVVGAGLWVGLGAGFVCLVGGGLLLGLRRAGAANPAAGRRATRPAIALGLLVAALVGVYLASLFHLATRLGVWEPDAVTTWTYRAKSLYFFNGLDVPSLRAGNAFAYPLWESMLQALDFLALGKADDQTFHLQFAIMLLSFLAAVVGLVRRAGGSPWVAPIFLGLFAISPEVRTTALSPLADLQLDYFFALAALLLYLWYERREGWALATASILLGAAIATKREGLLLAATVFVGALVLARREGRRRLLALLGAGAFAVLTFVPWRIWISLHDGATDVGNLQAGSLNPQLGTLLPAAHLLADRTFAYDAWLLLVPLACALAVVALSAPARAVREAGSFFLVTGLVSFAGFVAIWWLVPDVQTATNKEQPAVRLAGALAALSAVLAPILVARLSRSSPASQPGGPPDAQARRRTKIRTPARS
jgi:Dolichyl-phosphate-mannose-protein mannosyltransferase